MSRPRKKNIPNAFSKTLRSLMNERRMTIREASKVAGVASSTINDWCHGAHPVDFTAVKKLAKELGVSFSFLLTGEEDQKNLNVLPSITEVFDDGGELFDGYAKITIQRLIPRKRE